MSDQEKVDVILADPSAYGIYAGVPQREDGDPGRPPVYPPEVFSVLEALRAVHVHQRRIMREMRAPELFDRICAGIGRHVGAEQEAQLRRAGRLPGRATWSEFTRRAAPHCDPVDHLQRTALAHAEALGHFIGGPRSHQQPAVRDVVYGDGTVVKAPTDNRGPTYADRATGEICPQRWDDAAGLHHEAGDTSVRVFGPKWNFLATRSTDYLGALVLTLGHVPDGPGHSEVDVTLGLLQELCMRQPNIAGLVYDGALHGVHHEWLLRHGLLGISPVTAARVDRDEDGRTVRTEKEKILEVLRDGRCCHTLVGSGGYVCEKGVLDDGTPHLIPLAQKNEMRGSSPSCYWYIVVTIPCDHAPGGSHTHRIPLTSVDSDHDGPSPLKRLEVLRPVPPGSPAYDAIYGVRASAETWNSTLDRRLHFKRMFAYGEWRQRVALVGMAVGSNAIARHLAERRRREPAPTPPS